ncbi:Bgt-21000 [Blumeria graminis f. sp. tritici]|uniref:Bgt-21000 n=1 Tax=Blumeria graminis f. sp. tritici TaxID=62690 RepID=A0A9X9PQC3_BLUGR|nr:Bgt-21000 [Blumeria graminis f. sp. tritici]
MTFRVPDKESESHTSFSSYHSSSPESDSSTAAIVMDREEQGQSSFRTGYGDTTGYPLAGLSRQDIQGLIELLNERKSQCTVPRSTESMRTMRRDAVLPKWNGVQLDFGFFIAEGWKRESRRTSPHS